MAQTKRVNVKPVEIGLKVDYDEYREITRECDPDDRWSGEDSDSSWSVNSVSIVEKYPDVTACFPVKPGDNVFILYVVYSTGDSFSRNKDGMLVFIDVFLSRAKADAAAKAIQQHAAWCTNTRGYGLTPKQAKELQKKYTDAYSVNIVRENGSTLKVHASWNGYFESLSYVEAVNLEVGGGLVRYTLNY